MDAPAAFRGAAQAPIVLPVVTTSSTRITRRPCTSATHSKAPSIFAAPFLRAGHVDLGRRVPGAAQRRGDRYPGATAQLARQQSSLVVAALALSTAVQRHGHDQVRRQAGGLQVSGQKLAHVRRQRADAAVLQLEDDVADAAVHQVRRLDPVVGRWAMPGTRSRAIWRLGSRRGGSRDGEARAGRPRTRSRRSRPRGRIRRTLRAVRARRRRGPHSRQLCRWQTPAITSRPGELSCCDRRTPETGSRDTTRPCCRGGPEGAGDRDAAQTV